MKKVYENNSPAVRFLERGKQLMRLHGRVIRQMQTDMEAEGTEIRIRATVISEKTDMKEFLRDTMAKVASSQARFADIDLMFQLFLCRHVDNFQIFLEEIIRDVVQRDPSLVSGIKLRKADTTLPAAEQLERRLRKLSFMSLAEFCETLRTEMRFTLFSKTSDNQRATFLYDVRNLITHNFGIVDRHFHAKHPDSDVPEGTSYPLSPEFIKAAFEDLMKISHDVQTAAQKRFGSVYRTTVREVPDWHPSDP